MNVRIDQWRAPSCVALLILIVITFCLDFAHGIKLGQDNVLFGPTNRVRQSLAVALSRFYDPPAIGYVAYGSVVQVFKDSGFSEPGERGLRLAPKALIRLLNDGPELNRILKLAATIPIDPKLPLETIGASELGYADYIELSFRLFGINVSALYYFYFLLLGVACLLYLIEFRKSPLLLFLLVIFLAEQYFLHAYARRWGIELNAITNSRLFSGLALLPAAHIMFVLWRHEQPSAMTVASVFVQAALFAFIVTCRYEAMWQATMIVAACAALGLYYLFFPNRVSGWRTASLGPHAQFWPAGVLVVALIVAHLNINLTADARYAGEAKNHVFWHDFLMSTLEASPDLLRIYTPADTDTNNGDSIAFDTVRRHVNERNDLGSPVTDFDKQRNRIEINPAKSWTAYDQLAKAVVWRMCQEHPWLMFKSVFLKLGLHLYRMTVYWMSPWTSYAWQSLAFPAVICALGAVLCVLAGGMARPISTLGSEFAVWAFFVLFATMTPAMKPGIFSISSIFTHVAAVLIVVVYGISISIGWLMGVSARRLPMASSAN